MKKLKMKINVHIKTLKNIYKKQVFILYCKKIEKDILKAKIVII